MDGLLDGHVDGCVGELPAHARGSVGISGMLHSSTPVHHSSKSCPTRLRPFDASPFCRHFPPQDNPLLQPTQLTKMAFSVEGCHFALLLLLAVASGFIVHARNFLQKSWLQRKCCGTRGHGLIPHCRPVALRSHDRQTP